MLLILSFLQISLSSGFYLPGLSPVHFCDKKDEQLGCNSSIKVYVNRLNSDETVIPFEYNNFDFCKSIDDVKPIENLGQVLFGERIESSPYTFTFPNNQTNKFACEAKSYKPKDSVDEFKLDKIRSAIELNYQHHWIIDNMPVTFCYKIVETNENFCSTGFPVGCYINNKGVGKFNCELMLTEKPLNNAYYLFNHVDIIIEYHPREVNWGDNLPPSASRLVKARVLLKSIDHVVGKVGEDAFKTNKPLILFKKMTSEITIKYSYSISFQENNDIKWNSRWDYILESVGSAKINWFSILNSLIIVLFLSGMIAIILIRTLHKDIARYNKLDSEDIGEEEFGWKLIHADVFRPPRKGMLLSVLLGSGVQIFFMSLITLTFACLGFLSPANRGGLMTCVLVLYVLLAVTAGYFSARIYKLFGGLKWKFNVILTAILCPGIVFAIFFFLNLYLWILGSSGTIHFTTLLAILSLWFGISVPLSFVGAYFGFKAMPITVPVHTNKIPRQVPTQTLYTKPFLGIAFGGILPFGCIFIQLFFILSSIWSHHMYYMFGCLYLIFIILIIICSEATILLCYFHLCVEDYNWWWRSFLSSGSTAIYFFLYCIHYYINKMEITDFSSTFLYFGYTLIMVFLFFLLTGTIGFVACFWFVRKIYSVIKID